MSEYKTVYVPVYPTQTNSAPWTQPYVVGYRGATSTLPNPGESYITDSNGNIMRVIKTKVSGGSGTE